MPVSDAIAELGTGTYDLQRRTGSYQSGRWVDGPMQTLQLDAVIMPANPRDLQRLPEGARSTNRIVIYTATPLQVAQAGGPSFSDRVAYGDEHYEVESVEDWSDFDGGGYFKGLARKIEL